MKQKLLWIGIFCWLSLMGVAQDNTPKDGGGRLEALKIAYLTKKLNLTTEDAQKFWPVYNKYTAEIKQVRLQNKDADELVMEEKIINVRKKYKPEFTQVLPGERTNQFFKSDKEFNNLIQKEMMERRQMRMQRKQFQQ